MTVSITSSGIALDGPLVAGEKVSVTVSGLALAAEDKPTLALLARFPDALLASVELTESDTPGTWTGELDTATKQTALFFATARADERRDAALELVAGRVSLARLTVPMANSALCPKPDGSPFASPVYIPVPGPPGQGGDPYDQAPQMDGEASAGVSDEYARGDHRHPTDTSRASAADVTAIQNVIPSTATPSNKLATAADIPAAPVSSVNTKTGAVVLTGDDIVTGGVGTYASADISVAISDLDSYVIPGLRNSIAAQFDATATYAVGQLVFKGGTLYRCTTAHTGAWDASDFTTATVEGALETKANSSDLATVATTGDYGDLLNKPTIPAAQVNADWNAASGVAAILNKPTIPDVSGKAYSTAIAPAFSTSSTYAVGDYCTHEGLLYKCTTAVSTAGAWNAANWDAVAVTDEMGADTPLPFDAECEYVTVPDGTCINTEITSRGPILQWEMTIRMPSTFDTTGNFRFGSWTGQSPDSTMVWMSSGPRRLDMILSGDRYISDWSAITGQFGKIGYDGMYLFCGDSTVVGPSQSAGSGGASGNNFPFTLFGLNGEPQSGNIGGDISSARFSFCNSPVRDLVPVRVGQVGYLYDKVSGRLFGSAVGSIPLVPGPDKATPTITTPGRIVELTPAIRYSFTTQTPSVSGTSATVACEDRAINDFTVATGITSLTITPPAAVAGRARDFFCRVTLTDSSLPTVTLSGGTVDIGASEVAGMTQGVNLLMFTEIASGHWLASRRSAS